MIGIKYLCSEYFLVSYHHVCRPRITDEKRLWISANGNPVCCVPGDWPPLLTRCWDEMECWVSKCKSDSYDKNTVYALYDSWSEYITMSVTQAQICIHIRITNICMSQTCVGVLIGSYDIFYEFISHNKRACVYNFKVHRWNNTWCRDDNSWWPLVTCGDLSQHCFKQWLVAWRQ